MDKTLILNRIKKAYNLKNDAMLAKFFGVKPSTLSNWYSRNTVDFDLIFAKCEQINFDWLLTGRGEMLPNYSKTDEKCMICEEKEKHLVTKDKLIFKLEQENESLKEEINKIKKSSGVLPVRSAAVAAAG